MHVCGVIFVRTCGLYSTLDDQARFWRALLGDQVVFVDATTLPLLEEWVQINPGVVEYGLGLIYYDLDVMGFNGHPVILCHEGVYNNISLYIPALDAVIVLTLNSNRGFDFRQNWQFLAQTLSAIQRAGLDG